jgi:sulfoxide reductase heme-binding subunit YedZ
MSQKKYDPTLNADGSRNDPFSLIKVMVLGLLAGLLTLMTAVAIILYLRSPLSLAISNLMAGLFALNTQQTMWYITRSAGILAYFLLWFSTAWGLAVSSKILDNLLHRSFTYDFHEFISLLSIGFLALHIIVLTADKYLPYSIAQILVPFLSPYRPLWVGIGVIAFYLSVLVTVTFYIKSKIGMRAFRTIHILSLAGYFAALAHSFFSGTDTPLFTSVLMYAVTSLMVVFLFTYWLVGVMQKKASQKRPLPAASSVAAFRR